MKEAIARFCRERGLSEKDALELVRLFETALASAREKEQVSRRRRAEDLLEEATIQPGIAHRLRGDADILRQRARQILSRLGPEAGTEDKAEAWGYERRAADLESEARAARAEGVRLAWQAVLEDPQLETARQTLARYYRSMHQDAETRRDAEQAATYESFLRMHDPEGHHRRYLEGIGAVTLHTEVSCSITVKRWDASSRSWRPVGGQERLESPLDEHELPQGSYLFILQAPGRIPVRYPVHLRRGEHWNTIRPGEIEPTNVALPAAESWPEDEVYVPGGWFWAGGEDGIDRQRIWVDALAMKTHPVTEVQYDQFLRAIDPEQAKRFGRFQGQRPPTDKPVVEVAWKSADAYARWVSARGQHTWRMPVELEWEKASRGVDGRRFPWGDRFDPSLCRMRDSRPDSRRPGSVTEFREDQSVYGVMGCAGNVAEWCLNAPSNLCIRGDGLLAVALRSGRHTKRSIRGGRYDGPASQCVLARRDVATYTVCDSGIGFRLVRPL